MPIFLIDKIKQKNNGKFSLIDAQDVEIVIGSKTYNLLDYMKNNVATLGEDGTIPLEQIPTLVNDIINGHLQSNGTFQDVTGKIWELGTPDIDQKIFFDIDTKKRYLWSGVEFVELSSGVALGTTSTTAFYGDRGLATETKATENRQRIVEVENRLTNVEDGLGNKQDNLTPTQINNINDIPNKASKTDLEAKVNKSSIATINNKVITNGGNVDIPVGDKVVINSGEVANNVAYNIKVGETNWKFPVSGIEYEEIVKDELLGTWVFKDKLTMSGNHLYYNVSFTSNNQNYDSIDTVDATADERYVMNYGYYDHTNAYLTDDFNENPRWTNNAFKTIEITDTSRLGKPVGLYGSQSREKFTTWLKANATKQ